MSSAMSASTGVSAIQTVTINNVVPIHNDDTSLMEAMLLIPYLHIHRYYSYLLISACAYIYIIHY